MSIHIRLILLFIAIVVVGFGLFWQQYSTSLALERQKSTELQEAILEWLSPLDFSQKHLDTISSRSPGTGNWLIEHEVYRSWAKSMNNQSIWLQGIPGAGKTVLASIVVDDLQRNNQSKDVAVIAVYCDYKDTVRQTPENIVSAILAAIVRDRPLSDQLIDFYQTHRKAKVRPTTSELERALRIEIERFSSVFLVIDAIDEIMEKNGVREALMSVLSGLAPYVNIMLTSRPHLDITTRFPNIKRIKAVAKREDIRRYTKARISSNSSSELAAIVQKHRDLQNKVVEAVTNRSQGMFLLARLHLNILDDIPDARELRRTLKNLPSGLDEAYRNTTQRIENQSKQAREIAFNVLKWLSNVRRPITMSELQHALAVEPHTNFFDPEGIVDQKYILSVCKGLITLDDSAHAWIRVPGDYGHDNTIRPKSLFVRLVHYSVLEYLRDDSRFYGSQVQVQLATTCLTYLSFEDFGQIDYHCGGANKVQEFPFYSYAAGHWAEHARGEPETALQSSIFRFIGNRHNLFCAGRAYDGFSKMMSRAHLRPLLHLVAFGLYDSIQNAPKDLIAPELTNARHFSDMLTEASTKGYVRIVEFLLRSNKFESESEVLGNALHSAATYGHLDIVKALVRAGADVHGRYLKNDDTKPTDSIPLCSASKHGHGDIVKYLLTNGANPNIHGSSGFPLELAARRGHIQVAMILISHGALVDASSVWQGSPLLSASMSGAVEVLKLLLDNGARATRRVSVRPMIALGCGNSLKHQLIRDLRLENVTALHGATYCGYSEVVRLLITRGADVNDACYRQMTPLRIAAHHEIYYEIARILLDNGASIDGPPEASMTPLETAAYLGNTNITRVLLSRGANPNGPHRQLALVQAIIRGREGVVAVLLEYGATASYYALRTAASEGHLGIETLLLERASLSVRLFWKLYRPFYVAKSWAQSVENDLKWYFGLQEFPGIAAS